MKKTEVNLHSPVFAEFNENLNQAILQVLLECYEGSFTGGEIAAKISIELESGAEVFPAGEDENGKPKSRVYSYRKPIIVHKVTLTLKRRAEAKGSNNEPLELKRDGDDRFVLQEITKAQLTLDELGDRNEND